MLLIDTQKRDTDVEPFRTVYSALFKKGLAIPLPLKLMSASPPLFGGYVTIVKHYIEHPHFSQALKTAIRYHVASVSRFPACIEFNETALELLGKSNDKKGLAAEYPVSSLPKMEQQILSFVSDALFRPHLVTKARIEEIKEEGVSEQTLFDATVHGGLLLMMGPVVAAFSE